MVDEVGWIRRFYLEWALEGGVLGREFMEREGRFVWNGRYSGLDLCWGF